MASRGAVAMCGGRRCAAVGDVRRRRRAAAGGGGDVRRRGEDGMRGRRLMRAGGELQRDLVGDERCSLLNLTV